MDAKEAKEIICCYAENPYYLDLDSNFKYGFAKGYLDALEGPEVKALVKAAEGTDKRCLKYGQLPHNKVCLDIKTWTNDSHPFCHGCRLYRALAKFQANKVSGEGK